MGKVIIKTSSLGKQGKSEALRHGPPKTEPNLDLKAAFRLVRKSMEGIYAPGENRKEIHERWTEKIQIKFLSQHYE